MRARSIVGHRCSCPSRRGSPEPLMFIDRHRWPPPPGTRRPLCFVRSSPRMQVLLTAPHPAPPLSPPGIRGRSCAASTTAARGRNPNCRPPSSPQRSTEPPSTHLGCMQVLTTAPSPPPHRSTEPPSTYLGSTLRGSSLDGRTSSAHRLGPCCTASSWRQVRSSSRASSSSRARSSSR